MSSIHLVGTKSKDEFQRNLWMHPWKSSCEMSLIHQAHCLRTVNWTADGCSVTALMLCPKIWVPLLGVLPLTICSISTGHQEKAFCMHCVTLVSFQIAQFMNAILLLTGGQISNTDYRAVLQSRDRWRGKTSWTWKLLVDLTIGIVKMWRWFTFGRHWWHISTQAAGWMNHKWSLLSVRHICTIETHYVHSFSHVLIPLSC